MREMKAMMLYLLTYMDVYWISTNSPDPAYDEAVQGQLAELRRILEALPEGRVAKVELFR